MKITMIGGGSVQWTPILVTDVARTAELAGATFMLHDIDADALALLERASRRVVAELGADITIAATTDRAEALDGADYVILCVAIGGLLAVRDDLAIPQRYGIAQSVGDTVGPGGLIRGLRNIPFAVQVAREMEQRCPDAWLLNLSNPDDHDLPWHHQRHQHPHDRAVPRGRRRAPRAGRDPGRRLRRDRDGGRRDQPPAGDPALHRRRPRRHAGAAGLAGRAWPRLRTSGTATPTI